MLLQNADFHIFIYHNYQYFKKTDLMYYFNIGLD